MLEKVPGLRAVIDHLAKPEIRNQEITSWLSWMQKISGFENVWCKLSGMVTEADHKDWTQQDFEPYILGLVKSFGSKRLMYGSDWPVCLQAATYTEVYDLLIKCLNKLPDKLNDTQWEAIFGGNAAEFYKLSL